MTIRLVNTDRIKINENFPKPSQFPVLNKPHIQGILWYGIDDKWLQWAQNNAPDWLQPHHFALQIDEAKILKLSTERELAAFTMRFMKPKSASEMPPTYFIDWKAVAEKWAGIEVTEDAISHYHAHKARFFWLNGWDVPTGVIWDSSAIMGAEKLPSAHPLLTCLSQSRPQR